MTFEKSKECPREKLTKLIQKAPKAQLHLHLDGSLSYEFIKNCAEGIKDKQKDKVLFEHNWEPADEKELVKWFMDVAKVQHSNSSKAESNGNWRVFDVCNQFLQIKENLVEATYDLVKRLNDEHHVNYMEIRFAPVLHTKEGLTEKDAVLAVIEGFEKALKYAHERGRHVDGGIILCALRSFPVSHAIETVQLINTIDSEHVVGFDVAGDEGSFPLHLFEEALHLAKASNINITVHAGEWNENMHDTVIDNLKLAVDIGVNRIGHGLALRSLHPSDDLFAKMKAKNISVEVCITSNCDSKTKCASFEEHPIAKFLENKVDIAALNVDNLMLAGNHETGLPAPTGEFVRAVLDCGVKPELLLDIVRSSYAAAFKEVPSHVVDEAVKYWNDEVIPHL